MCCMIKTFSLFGSVLLIYLLSVAFSIVMKKNHCVLPAFSHSQGEVELTLTFFS